MPDNLGDMVELDRSCHQSERRRGANAQQAKAHHKRVQRGTNERLDPRWDRTAAKGADKPVVGRARDRRSRNCPRDQSAIAAYGSGCSFVGTKFGCQPQLIRKRSQQRQDGHAQLANKQVAVVLLLQVRTLVSEHYLPLSRCEHIQHAL